MVDTPNTSPTLVVVDDDPDVLRATARTLQMAGYQVVTGVNAAQALTLTRQHLPALLLLDVMLPDGNGVDVARQVKSDAALAGVFVILLSGLKVSSEDQAQGEGAVDHSLGVEAGARRDSQQAGDEQRAPATALRHGSERGSRLAQRPRAVHSPAPTPFRR